MKKIWPKWIRVVYYTNSSPEINSLTIGSSNAVTLHNELSRLNITVNTTIELTIDDRQASEEEIRTFFQWLWSRYLKEEAEFEKRKKAK